MQNSDLMSVFVEADIFISVCNFEQSAASSPLTPNMPVVLITCIFNVAEMCSFIIICFYIGFICSKYLYDAVQHSYVNMIQRGKFFISSRKNRQ